MKFSVARQSPKSFEHSRFNAVHLSNCISGARTVWRIRLSHSSRARSISPRVSVGVSRFEAATPARSSRITSDAPAPYSVGTPARKYPFTVAPKHATEQTSPILEDGSVFGADSAKRRPARKFAKSNAISSTAYDSSSSAAAIAKPSPFEK